MILDQIVDSTRRTLAEQKARTPLASIEEALRHQEPPRDLAGALQGQDISLIAEIKRASPSKGVLRQDLAAPSLARIYSEAGAAAVSVLTESDYFQGAFADLQAVRAEVNLPLLCKDFVVDRYQVFKARAHGADAVLLIVAILTQSELRTLFETARSLGMTAVVEVHSREELERALQLSPQTIGINNRNLSDFSVDLETTLGLLRVIPEGVTVVSESGIHTRADVVRLENAGADAILVGEALVTSHDPAAKIGELLGRSGHLDSVGSRESSQESRWYA
jgi:indole-3-glycerol phosphate synthase